MFEFQKGLLRKELYRAKEDHKVLTEKVAGKRGDVQKSIPEKILPSVAFHSRQSVKEVRKLVKNTHQKKLLALSEEQERPLFNG